MSIIHLFFCKLYFHLSAKYDAFHPYDMPICKVFIASTILFVLIPPQNYLSMYLSKQMCLSLYNLSINAKVSILVSTYQQIRQFSTKASNRLTENITIHLQKYNLPIVRSTKLSNPLYMTL